MLKTFKTTCDIKSFKPKVNQTIYCYGSLCIIRQIRLLEKTRTKTTYELTVERLR